MKDTDKKEAASGQADDFDERLKRLVNTCFGEGSVKIGYKDGRRDPEKADRDGSE